MTDTWRYEIYNRKGNLCAQEDGQTYERIWLAALDCPPGDILKFAPPKDAVASEIDQLLQLGAVRLD